jgi:hypothetical protein
MVNNESAVPALQPLVQTVRNRRVILDFDLARLLGVSTKRLNQEVRRNRRRFPPDFAFVLTQTEAASKRLQIATASRKRNRRNPPVAYTGLGTAMAANVVNSEIATMVSVEIVRALFRAVEARQPFETFKSLLNAGEASTADRSRGERPRRCAS